MRKARFTEHQIITILKYVETDRTVKDVCSLKPRTTTGNQSIAVWKPVLSNR